jgi:hypothetical protein
MTGKNNWHTDTKDQNIHAVPFGTRIASLLWRWANGRHIIRLWWAQNKKKIKTRNKNEFITELYLSFSRRKIFYNIVLAHPI